MAALDSLVALFAGWVLSTLHQPPQTGFNLNGFGRLPVLLNGRIQPMDSVARNALLQIRNKQSVALESNKEMSAIEWMVELMMKPEAADDRKVFRVDHPELLDLLKLPQNEKHFSFNQLTPSYDEIGKQSERIDKIDQQVRTPFEKQVMKLANALFLYQRLELSLRPPNSDNFLKNLEAARRDVAAIQAQKGAHELDVNQPEVVELAQFVSGWDLMAQRAYPLVVPPEDGAKSRDDWEGIGTSLMTTFKQGRIAPAVMDYAAMVTAYRENKPVEFNLALQRLPPVARMENLRPKSARATTNISSTSFRRFTRR